MVHAVRMGWAAGVLPVVLVVAAASGGTASFTADLVTSEEGVERRGTLQVSGERYRMDLPQPDGPDVVVLVDRASDLTRVLVPRYAVYLEIGASSGLARMQDPFAGMRWAASQYATRVEGEEERDGWACRRELVHYEGTPVLTRWIDAELGWPVRLEMAQPPDTWVRLENIEGGEVDPARFAVPDGYERVERPGLYERIAADEEMQAKAAEWERTRPRTQRVQRMLGPGSETRLLLGDDVAVAAEVRYAMEEPLRWTVAAVLEGEEGAGFAFEGPARAEQLRDLRPEALVLRCLEGRGGVTLTLRGRLPLVVATAECWDQTQAGGRSWSPGLGGWRHLRVAFTATQEDGPARATFRVQHGERGATTTKEHELELAPGETRVLEWSAADGSIAHFDLMLRSGALRVEVVEDTREPADRSPF